MISKRAAREASKKFTHKPGGTMSENGKNDVNAIEAALDASVDASIRLTNEIADLKRFNEALLAMLGTLLDAWHEGDLEGTIKKIAAELEAISKRKIN